MVEQTEKQSGGARAKPQSSVDALSDVLEFIKFDMTAALTESLQGQGRPRVQWDTEVSLLPPAGYCHLEDHPDQWAPGRWWLCPWCQFYNEYRRTRLRQQQQPQQ